MPHLRFFFEYGVDTPLWPDSMDSPYGYPCDLELLPVTPATRAELARLADGYQSSLNQEYPPGPTPWPRLQQELFNEQAISVLQTLRHELGDTWTVHDEFHRF
ncbi:hypothetical protein [Streptomyces sp. NPDC096323]|uniref:hypothetical protein n=1 Tax=Streptomyces sp. NPDC096323 TaxID=3155822 RepID=UPI003331743B